MPCGSADTAVVRAMNEVNGKCHFSNSSIALYLKERRETWIDFHQASNVVPFCAYDIVVKHVSPEETYNFGCSYIRCAISCLNLFTTLLPLAVNVSTGPIA